MKYVKGRNNNLSDWGQKPGQRSVDELIPRSLVILDKPEGPSSHQVSSWVKKIFDKKAAHSGTLDPNVTGVLPTGIGDSVRVLDLLHTAPKEYIAAMKFHGRVNKREVDEILSEYEGEIYQTPPLRSGVKRERRKRYVYEIERLYVDGNEYLLRVRCESGTYIRTLCKDIGKTLGTGGHMMELRRTEAGGFTEEQVVLLQDLRDAYEFYREGDDSRLKEVLIPYEAGLEIYPQIKVKDSAAGAVLNGADLAAPGILEMDEFSEGDEIVLISAKKEGLAFGKAMYDAEEIIEKKGDIVVRTDRVFNPSGDYPEEWK